MKHRLHNASLFIGLLVTLAVVTLMARMAYDSHSWVSGSIGIAIYVTASILAFRKMRSVYLNIRPSQEEREVNDFNRKAKSFVAVNLFLMVGFLAILEWLHR